MAKLPKTVACAVGFVVGGVVVLGAGVAATMGCAVEKSTKAYVVPAVSVMLPVVPANEII